MTSVLIKIILFTVQSQYCVFILVQYCRLHFQLPFNTIVHCRSNCSTELILEVLSNKCRSMRPDSKYCLSSTSLQIIQNQLVTFILVNPHFHMTLTVTNAMGLNGQTDRRRTTYATQCTFWPTWYNMPKYTKSTRKQLTRTLWIMQLVNH